MGYRSLSRKDHAVNVLLYLIGVCFIPLGIVIAMHAHLGVAGVDSLSYVISGRLGISVSVGVYATTFVSLVIGAIIRKSYPRIQCYLTSLVYGLFQGIWDVIIPQYGDAHMLIRLLLLLLGIVIAGSAAGFYLQSKLPVNPNDDLLLAMREKGMGVMQAKLTFEITCFLLALLAHGEIGIGTIAFMVLLGPIMGFWSRRLEKVPAVIRLDEDFRK